MKITDGKKTVDIRMMTWEGSGYSPDWSLDFFEAGGLPYNEETDVYTVKDVDYCINQAQEWKDTNTGFTGDQKPENNEVFIDEL
jgi:hypothetical protein